MANKYMSLVLIPSKQQRNEAASLLYNEKSLHYQTANKHCQKIQDNQHISVFLISLSPQANKLLENRTVAFGLLIIDYQFHWTRKSTKSQKTSCEIRYHNMLKIVTIVPKTI